MNSILLDIVTDASLRSAPQLEQYAIEQASAGTPWLNETV